MATIDSSGGMNLSVGGLASGLDTSALIDKLMSIERQPRVRLDLRERQAEARKSALSDIGSRLRLLAGAASDLRLASAWGDVQSVESGDATKVAVRRIAGAGPGGYQIAVTQLARAAQRTFTYTPPAAATTLTINGTAVDVAAGADLAAVVDAINAKSDTGVFAVAVSGNLVLSTRTTGADAPITVGADPALVEQAALAKPGLNAQYSVDGGPVVESSSNVVTSAIPGVELTLKGVTTAPVAVTVGAPAPDPDAVKAKVKAFVDQYNATVTAIRAKLTEKPVANPQTSADQLKGVLYGDTMLDGVLARMRAVVSDIVAGNPSGSDQLADIGISTGAAVTTGSSSRDALAGKLVIDDEKLSAAIASDPQSVRRLLGAVSGVDGFAQKFQSALAPLTQAGGGLDGRLSAADAEIAQLHASMAAMDSRLELKEQRLRAQFTAMETALSSSQSQGQWLAGQLAHL